jgi:hypothetical protein
MFLREGKKLLTLADCGSPRKSYCLRHLIGGEKKLTRVHLSSTLPLILIEVEYIVFVIL